MAVWTPRHLDPASCCSLGPATAQEHVPRAQQGQDAPVAAKIEQTCDPAESQKAKMAAAAEAASRNEEKEQDNPGMVKTYSLIRYTSPGVMHLFLMHNSSGTCAFRVFERVASRSQLVTTSSSSGDSFGSSGAKFSQRAALECQVIITVLTAAAHTRTLERRKALDTENRMLSQVRRFLLGS
eukprot:Tamp_17103.p1 GENE.Tamp_17103~~Tamp_17103.p1  ORF type:complete len:182 (+),score=29.43 Tamp_17103:841-1386(+)